MDNKTRLSYYKRLKIQGITLTADQQTDYAAIVREVGDASVEPMPLESSLYQQAKQTL